MRNPLEAWLEHDARERAKDREMLLEAIREVLKTAHSHSEVAKEQSKMLQAFFAQFLQVSGAPESRTLRDEDEYAAEVERYNFKLHGGEN